MITHLGNKIRAARKKKNFNQAQLAEKIGVKTSAVGQYEIGASRPSLDVLFKISNALGVSTDWLLNDSAGYEEVLSTAPTVNNTMTDTNNSDVFANKVVQLIEQQLAEKDQTIKSLLKLLDAQRMGKLDGAEFEAEVRNLLEEYVTCSVTTATNTDFIR